ncbi:serine protease FAM111A-like [Clarias gariepinus]|uniref:serine protease FAM111A-like n=1 Tax=Clarias gariepinus TaxID=13013 RepID=UPI00234D1345|nr:serine protease FAM111A-like [Clarias gariepinus]
MEGRMNIVVKEEREQCGRGMDTSQRRTKSFKFCYNKRNYKVTCDQSMTIQEALHSNDSFKSISENNQQKALIIERRTTLAATVTPDFPICLIDENETLDIDFKTVRKISTVIVEKTPLEPALMAERENFVSFYISKNGGANIQYILQHINLIETSYVCVYAVKGKNVEAALRRDGRFKEKIFQKGILYEESSKTFINLSEPVDVSLNGMKFQIIINPNPTKGLKSTQIDKKHNDCGTPETSSTEKKKIVKEKESRKYPEAKEIPNTQEILNILREQHSDLLKTLKQREDLKSNVEVKNFSIKEIPNSQEILSILKNQYEDLVKTLKEQKNLKDDGELKKFFRVEYDKSVQSFSEVNRVKELIRLSDSVCQIRNSGSPRGTGFLLFKRFVLTNKHVVRDLFPCITGRPHNLTAVFGFEVLNTSVTEIPVEQNFVADFYGKDDIGNHLDFALLELSSDVKFPELIRCYSPPPIMGGVCIIGHPDNGVKRMDPCFIIRKENVQQEIAQHCENNPNIHVINKQCLAENWEVKVSQISYNSCFFHGSSGSPVFDDYCNLIGVHTGGYVYPGESGETRSVMEFGFPMFPILKQILIQCSGSGRSDVVQEFWASSNLKLVVNKAKEQLPREHQAN